MDISSLIGIGVTVVTPIIVAGVKKLVPKIPAVLLPVIAGISGGAIGTIANVVSHNQSNTVLVALLGLAGVGFREVYDQTKQVVSSDSK